MLDTLPRAVSRPRATTRLAKPLIIVLMSLLLPAMAISIARTQEFDHDEIYTVLISELPTISHIWNAEREGIDSAPPLNELLTRGAHAVFGVGLVATRLPAILGYSIATVVLFLMVSRRSNVVSGISAAALLFYSLGFRYAFVARGYGVMLGLFALALYLWAEAARDDRRAFVVPLLTLVLTASLWNHYYAILTFIPLIVGEVVRAVRRRRVDWHMAIAFVLPIVSLLPLIPHMRAVSAEAATYWERASLDQILPTYESLAQFLFGRRFLIAYVLAVMLPVLDLARRRLLIIDARRLPSHEVAAGVAALLIPVCGILLGISLTGVFTARYALAGVIGIALVVPLAVWCLSMNRKAPALLLCLGLVGGFVRSPYAAFMHMEPPDRTLVEVRPKLVAALRGDTPVVITGTFYLQAWYYAAPELRRNMFALVDTEAAVRFGGTDSIDRDFSVLRRWTPVDIRDYAPFGERASNFIVYRVPNDKDATGEWLLPQLEADDADIELMDQENGAWIYSVHLSPNELASLQ